MSKVTSDLGLSLLNCLGNLERKSISFLINELVFSWSGFIILSIRWLKWDVGEIGSATIGRNVKSIGDFISMYSDICSLIAVAIILLL